MLSHSLLHRELTGKLDHSRFFGMVVQHALGSKRKLLDDRCNIARVHLWTGGLYVYKSNEFIISFDRYLKRQWTYPLSFWSSFHCSEDGLVVAIGGHNPDYTEFSLVGHDGVLKMSKRVERLSIVQGFLKGAADPFLQFVGVRGEESFLCSLDVRTFSIQRQESVGVGFHLVHVFNKTLIFKKKENYCRIFCEGQLTRLRYARSSYPYGEFCVEVSQGGWRCRHLVSGVQTSGPLQGGVTCLSPHLFAVGQQGLIFWADGRIFFVNMAENGRIPHEIQLTGFPGECADNLLVTSSYANHSFKIWDCSACFQGGQPAALTPAIEGSIKQLTKDFFTYYEYGPSSAAFMFVDFR